MFSLTGQGGHAYLKEWLWWAGLLSSMYRGCFKKILYVYIEIFMYTILHITIFILPANFKTLNSGFF